MNILIDISLRNPPDIKGSVLRLSFNTRFCTFLAVCILVFAITGLTSCGGSSMSSDISSLGVITISFGAVEGTSSRAAAWPSENSDGVLPYLEHHITLNGPTGEKTYIFKEGKTSEPPFA